MLRVTQLRFMQRVNKLHKMQTDEAYPPFSKHGSKRELFEYKAVNVRLILYRIFKSET